jgi:hypothetical protein
MLGHKFIVTTIKRPAWFILTASTIAETSAVTFRGNQETKDKTNRIFQAPIVQDANLTQSGIQTSWPIPVRLAANDEYISPYLFIECIARLQEYAQNCAVDPPRQLRS